MACPSKPATTQCPSTPAGSQCPSSPAITQCPSTPASSQCPSSPANNQSTTSVTISYSSSGHTSGSVPTNHSVNTPGSTQLKSHNLLKTGYTFGGWRNGSNIFQSGQNVNFTGSVILIFEAVWNVNTNRLSSIKSDIMWCQTGGWYTENNGSDQCARTASATTASINSSFTVKPIDVEYLCASVTINGTKLTRKGRLELNNGTKDYDFATFKSNIGTNNEKGYIYYNFDSKSEVLYAINYELNHDRAVIVKTNGAGTHWVTVTNTTTGKDATCFNELMGIDPWFNGNNPPNKKDGPSTDRGNGIVILSGDGIQNQNDFLDYCIMTVNRD